MAFGRKGLVVLRHRQFVPPYCSAIVFVALCEFDPFITKSTQNGEEPNLARHRHRSMMFPKLASYPFQNALAVVLRESGRIERTLFALETECKP